MGVFAMCSGCPPAVPKSDATTVRLSARPVPWVSRQRMSSGGTATSAPPFTARTERGITTPSTNAVALSMRPSPSVSVSRETRPEGSFSVEPVRSRM